jgi:DNA recombination protein Rad52
MAFTDEQVHRLRAKLDGKHVKTRYANGAALHYVEGWHAIAEANRIFGHDAWDRRTLSTKCVWTGTNNEHYSAAYTAKVRVRVRAGDVTIVREGSGTGEGRALTPGQAHELALKGAETDATKRALATFGNPFGLALYDREHAGVRKARGVTGASTQAEGKGPWVLRMATGAPLGTFDKPDVFADALHNAMSGAKDIELLFAIWEKNIGTVRAINKRLKLQPSPRDVITAKLVAHLKERAVALAKAGSGGISDQHADRTLEGRSEHTKIDKSVLTISEPKRHRSPEHLRLVRQQPCLVCGRAPSQAHHIRHAQSRGMALKVSDEFTVPLCAIHHMNNHATGDERRWWREHSIDPIAVAEQLWRQSHASNLSLAPISSVADPTSVESQETTEAIDAPPS